MSELTVLQTLLHEKFADVMTSIKLAHGEITMEIPAEHILPVAKLLRDDPDLQFEQLMDVSGVDYLAYGVSDWQTESATGSGFDRAVSDAEEKTKDDWQKPRFVAVYHLLSIAQSHRLRLKVFLSEQQPIVNSVISVWQSANWFEREAFDMFGIFFKGHPDLRRILTDYGFIGHPFRKDFPLIGHVEVRYDAAQDRVIYQPVSIKPRTLVPRVVRDDSRYLDNKNVVAEAAEAQNG